MPGSGVASPRTDRPGEQKTAVPVKSYVPRQVTETDAGPQWGGLGTTRQALLFKIVLVWTDEFKAQL